MLQLPNNGFEGSRRYKVCVGMQLFESFTTCGLIPAFSMKRCGQHACGIR